MHLGALMIRTLHHCKIVYIGVQTNKENLDCKASSRLKLETMDLQLKFCYLGLGTWDQDLGLWT